MRDSHLPEPGACHDSQPPRQVQPVPRRSCVTGAAPAHAQGIESPRVPVRTAIKEINTLRAEYADLYNKKDAKALTAMYLPDAVLIRGDGSTLSGQDAIGKDLADQAPSWKHDSHQLRYDAGLRQYGLGHGQAEHPGPNGEASVSHYLVVLRRGVEKWQISSVAVVPVTQVTTTK